MFLTQTKQAFSRYRRLVCRELLALCLLSSVTGPGSLTAAEPVVRYTQQTSFSVPFNISSDHTEEHQALLWQRPKNRGEWKLVQAIPARIGAFNIDAPQNGEYRFAVTTSDLGNTITPPESGAGELVVVVDNQKPAVSLTMRNWAWRTPQLECLIADPNADFKSMKLQLSLTGSDSVIDVPCQPQLVQRQTESGIWHCYVPLPPVASPAVLTCEIRDFAGNATVETIHYVPSLDQPSPSPSPQSQRTASTASAEPSISFDLSGQLSDSDSRRMPEKDQRPGHNNRGNDLKAQQNRSTALRPNEPKDQLVIPVLQSLWEPSLTASEFSDTGKNHDPPKSAPFHNASFQDDNSQERQRKQKLLQLPASENPEAASDIVLPPVPTDRPPVPAVPPNQSPAETSPEYPAAPTVNPLPVIRETQTNSDLVTEFDVWLRSARNKRTTGDLEQALSHYDRCLQLNPDSTDAFRERTLLLAEMQPAAAVPHLRTLLSKTPQDYDAAYALSRIYSEQSRYDQSLKIIEETLQYRPEDVRLQASRIQLLVDAGRIQQALSALQQLSMDQVQQQPDYSSASFVRSLMVLNRADTAITMARALYDSDPLNSNYGFVLAEALAAIKSEQEAILIVNALDADDPGFLSNIQKLTDFAIAQNLLDLAGTCLARAREHSADSSELRILAVKLSLARRDYQAAQLRISSAPDQWQNDELILDNARIQMQLGLYAEAETVLRQLSKEGAGSIDASLMWAELYTRLQAYDLAENALSVGLSHHPGNTRLQNAMARLYTAAGKPALALGMTETTFESDPLNAEAWMLWAVAHAVNKSSLEAEMRLQTEDLNGLPQQIHGNLLQIISAFFKAEQHNYPGALTEFELTGFPDDPARYPVEFGYAYYRSLSTCRSPQDARRFLIKITSNVKYAIELAQTAQKHNDFLLAKQILLSVAAERSGDPGVLDVLGQLLIRTDGPAAEAVFQDIIAMQPTSIPGRHGLAIVKWRQRDFETALVLLDGLLSDVTYYRSGLRDRARLVADWKGAAAAMPEYDRAEQALQNPISSSAERALLSDTALLRSDLGYRSISVEELFAIRLEKQARFLADWRPDNATATLRRLQKIRPQDSMVAFLLAEQNLRMGRYRQAEMSLQELLVQDPENPRIHAAIRHTQKELQPTIDAHAEYFDQSGRNGLSEISRLRLGPTFSQPFGLGHNVVSFGYRHIRLMPPTDYDGLQLIETATQALAFADTNVEAANQAFNGLIPGTPEFQQAVDNVNAARAAQTSALNALNEANQALVTDTLGNALQFGLHLEPNQNWTVDLDLAAEFYDSGFASRPVFELQAVNRLLDGLKAGFSFSLENVAENSESIRQDIFRYGGGPQFHWQATSRWTVDGRSRFIRYSDDNSLLEFDVNNEVVLYRAPRSLTAVVRFHGEQFSKETVRNPVLTNLAGTVHPYFAPSDFAYFTAGLRWKHWLSRLALGENELSYSARSFIQWDNAGVFYNVAGASLDWDITDNLTLATGVDLVRSTEYDSTSAFGVLVWYMP